MYDIVFISYNEDLADHNYKTLCERFPIAQRVKGVKGIHTTVLFDCYILMSKLK